MKPEELEALRLEWNVDRFPEDIEDGFVCSWRFNRPHREDCEGRLRASIVEHIDALEAENKRLRSILKEAEE